MIVSPQDFAVLCLGAEESDVEALPEHGHAVQRRQQGEWQLRHERCQRVRNV